MFLTSGVAMPSFKAQVNVPWTFVEIADFRGRESFCDYAGGIIKLRQASRLVGFVRFSCSDYNEVHEQVAAWLDGYV